MNQMAANSYRERLLPGVGWIALLVGFVAMVAVAYAAALGTLIGLVVFVGGVLLVLVSVARTAPVICVDDQGIWIGATHLPSNAIGATRILTSAELDAARRGHDVDIGMTAYMVQPPWSPRKAVAVAVADGSDPHSAWLIASRRPEQLRQAVADHRTNRDA
jgi:hypothetical protein